jgi:hypothetical protein
MAPISSSLPTTSFEPGDFAEREACNPDRMTQLPAIYGDLLRFMT